MRALDMNLIRRLMTPPLKLIDSLLPNGFYRGRVKGLIQWLEKLTCGYWMNMLVRECLGKTDLEWPAELLQTISLAFGILLLAILRYSPVSQSLVTILIWLIIFWRVGEVFVFALNWVFVHTGPVISYKRSLAGFGINIAEIVVYFAIAYLQAKCVKTPSIFSALYSSLRTVVTIGPDNVVQSGYCGALIIIQIAVAYFLAIVVIAIIVGSLNKRGEI